ncbi:MAG: right-handed parallel beta-helix repeat-containing protein [Planctomycetaceae bacterium]|nr:right-handed parallel beta-helix repeat-containing protein [Planctomycetaceae bacterium]
MLTRQTRWLVAAVWIAILSVTTVVSATQYFVTKQGSDNNTGTTRATAWATIQKGVDALQPGDALTIAPGEYFESIKRADLGDLEHDTQIRAELLGTVIVRGDRPAPQFRPVPGQRFVYVADFAFDGQIPAVNEIDTLKILKRMPNAAELEFIPGTFFHDAQTSKLYISTTDLRPADAHTYSVSVIPRTGLHLIRPKRVTVEGLAFTGFSAMELIHYREETAGGIWGLFVVHGKQCVIRDCRAYLNAWGIGFNSISQASGDNVIERCVSWANKSTFANGDMGGITVFNGRRDTIRDCVAYRNGMYGINIYGTGGAPPHGDDGGNDPKHKSMLVRNYAWGNDTADLKIKTGYEYHHIAESCVAPGLWSVANVIRGTIGRSAASKAITEKQHILLSDVPTLDPRAEFADPDNHDYRLQATSQFRSVDPSSASDRGAFPYQPNIFYVRPDGDDAADGLSVSHAWKTLARAVKNLQPGATVYLEPGEYAGDVSITAVGKTDSPITIRGRGVGPVTIHGALKLVECNHLRLERLTFTAPVTLATGRDLTVDQATFSGNGRLVATGVAGLTVSHCHFANTIGASLQLDDSTQLDLRGNAFLATNGPAVQLQELEQIRYANYNGYARAEQAWQVNGEPVSLAKLQTTHEPQSRALDAASPHLAGGGPFGKPLGPYRDELPATDLRLAVKPSVFSVSDTTANLEWITTAPATCSLSWGATPECKQSLPFNVNCFGSYSLTGLKPATKYYFRITKLETPADMLPKPDHYASVPLSDEPLAFTTQSEPPKPRTFYVANDGDDQRSGRDRQQAWRTIRHAATQVAPGDTVLIAGGTYRERIRLRVTGAPGQPITFQALPGERVELNGHDMTLNSGFVAGGKSHLRFDGLYFAAFNLFPNDKWSLLNSGEFHLYHGKDIQITRCFSEGRGGYSASPVAAYFVEDLLIKNCVNTYKFGGMYFWRCPNLVIENTVFAEPMIMAFVLRNTKQQSSTLRNCIFTDMLDKKARLNLGILCCDGDIDAFRTPNNCFYLRDCIPLEERVLQGTQTAKQLSAYVIDPIFVDPQFAGDPGVKGNPSDKSGFSPDRMMDATFPVDFPSFYAQHPELIRRDIGLQPQAFEDFHFRK